MRILLIVDETNFHQPKFVSDLISKSGYEFVGAILVTKILAKSNLELYLKKHWWYLKPTEIIKLGLNKIFYKIGNCFSNKNFFSVKAVFRFYNIDFIDCHYEINEKNIEYIKSKKPDVIISSNSIIFDDVLIKIPKLACINRHSSLLPSYAGLWPIIQAYRNGEKEVGVSVHSMTKKIDQGIILSQKIINIKESDTIDTLYKKCFSVSATVVIEALKKIEKNDFTNVYNNYLPSYYSFPTKQDWKEFRERGGKFI